MDFTAQTLLSAEAAETASPVLSVLGLSSAVTRPSQVKTSDLIVVAHQVTALPILQNQVV